MVWRDRAPSSCPLVLPFVIGERASERLHLERQGIHDNSRDTHNKTNTYNVVYGLD